MNNMAVYQHQKFVQSNEEYIQSSMHAKRKRTDDEQHSEMDTATKRRQPKSLFRPWSSSNAEEETPTATVKMSKTSPTTVPTAKISPNLAAPQTVKVAKTSPKTIQISKTSPKTPVPSVSYQTKLPLPQAPVLISPYQLAVQQQQRQTALAMQQAVYQRQLMLAHIWAHQQQQQQLQMQHHLRQQQQLFAFGAQPGHK